MNKFGLFPFQNGKLQKALTESQEQIKMLKQELNEVDNMLKDSKSQLIATKEKVHDYFVCEWDYDGKIWCAKYRFTIDCFHIFQVLRRKLGEMQTENDKLTNDLSEKCERISRTNVELQKLQEMYDSLHGDYK